MSYLKLDDLELVNYVDYGQALQMREALDAALDAMVYYGSDDEHLTTITLMLTNARKIQHAKLQERIEDNKAKTTT